MCVSERIFRLRPPIYIPLILSPSILAFCLFLSRSHDLRISGSRPLLGNLSIGDLRGCFWCGKFTRASGGSPFSLLPRNKKKKKRKKRPEDDDDATVGELIAFLGVTSEFLHQSSDEWWEMLWYCGRREFLSLFGRGEDWFKGLSFGRTTLFFSFWGRWNWMILNNIFYFFHSNDIGLFQSDHSGKTFVSQKIRIKNHFWDRIPNFAKHLYIQSSFFFWSIFQGRFDPDKWVDLDR